MEVRAHHDVREFWELSRPVFAADPVRHTQALTVVRRVAEAPLPDAEAPTLLTLWSGTGIVGAAFRSPPWPLIVSAVPEEGFRAVADWLVDFDPALPRATGPRDVAEGFAEVWAKLTGATVREAIAMRLYRLGTLEPPVVPGRVRSGTIEDVRLLTSWLVDFGVEARAEEPAPERMETMVRQSLAVGNGMILWEVDGRPVAFAAVAAPIHGMSRVGPVYTPPELRGHGYGSAVTAAASRWALDAGAEHVLLFTDLANPTSNLIYRRLGYRPVGDHVELSFEP